MEHISGLETLQHLEILDLADNQVQMQQSNLVYEYFVWMEWDFIYHLLLTRFITSVNTYFQLGGPRSIITPSCIFFTLHDTMSVYLYKKSLALLSDVILVFTLSEVPMHKINKLLNSPLIYSLLGGPRNPRSIITTSCIFFTLHATMSTWWYRKTLA